jgi:hypothetical protein
VTSRLIISALAIAAFAAPASARESLGLWSGWGAFRDDNVPRCYAIAKAIGSPLQRDYEPYATVGTWPKKGLRNQVHFRMSRELAAEPNLTLKIGSKSFKLIGGGNNAWAADKRINAAIIAQMRSAKSMTVSARGANGKGFSNTWPLAGAATAMDAAAIGCARIR